MIVTDDLEDAANKAVHVADIVRQVIIAKPCYSVLILCMHTLCMYVCMYVVLQELNTNICIYNNEK